MEKIWIKSYQAGIESVINPNKYQSLVEIFTEACNKYSNLAAFANFGTNLSYKELQQKSLAFAAYLQNVLQLVKGDRVAIMLPNVLQYPVSLFGILAAGLVVVNINPLCTTTELTKQLKDSGAKVVIVLENFAHSVEQVLNQVPLEHIIITHLGDLLGNFKGKIVNYIVKHVKKLVPVYNIKQAIKFTAALGQGSKHTWHEPKLSQNDIAFLQYTGGTTGIAKGAMLSHRNFLANLEQIFSWTSQTLNETKEIIITALPMYHVFSLTVNCLAFINFGALNVLITDPRDTAGFIKEISKYKFTIITGVNTLYNALLNSPKFKRFDFSTLKLSIAGGMALQKVVADKWQQVTGLVLMEGYGLTEASPVVCMNPLNLPAYNGTIGLPLPSTEISIRDDHDQELGIDEIGELWVRGPQVMLGYWQQPLETSAVLSADKWLKTGDVASINAAGYVKIVDRKKDMIIISGFKVYPNEIENVIVGLDGVKEVAVIGVHNPVTQGEQVKAIIVKNKPDLTDMDIIQYCHQYLSAYKIPKIIEFRQELPKTNVGKILRRALKT